MLEWFFTAVVLLAVLVVVVGGNLLLITPLLRRGFRPWRRRPPFATARKNLWTVVDQVSIPTRVLVRLPTRPRPVDTMLVSPERLLFLAAGGAFEVRRTDISALTVVDWYGIGWGRGFLISSAAGTWDCIAAFPLNADAALATLSSHGWPIGGPVTARSSGQ